MKNKPYANSAECTDKNTPKNSGTRSDIHANKSDWLTGRHRPVSSRINKYVYIAFGVLFFGFGALGAVLPVIPTTPLILLSAFCFAKSSQRLHKWCLSTSFYKNNVENFVNKRAMTRKAKATLITSVTIVMGLSITAMILLGVPVFARILLGIVWLCHVIYFGFIVKTLKR